MKRFADDAAAPADVRAMIAAARADMPAPAALARILARIEQGTPPPRGGAGRRLILVGGGAAIAVALGVFLLRGHRDSSTRAPEPAAEPPVQAPAQAPVVSALPDDAAPSPSPPAPAEKRSAPARPHHVAPPPAPPPPPPSEVSLVEAARASLAAREFRAALAAAARHEKLYPTGVLAEEREAIRVEALAGSGEATAARDRLRGFLHRFPRSSYRRHLEELVPPP